MADICVDWRARLAFRGGARFSERSLALSQSVANSAGIQFWRHSDDSDGRASRSDRSLDPLLLRPGGLAIPLAKIRAILAGRGAGSSRNPQGHQRTGTTRPWHRAAV